jgi:MoaA/NifB/PqqE/SkfB family radical SAM enzyme
MARRTDIVTRRCSWGVIHYNALSHEFSYKEERERCGEPYPNVPVVLNVVVTRRCNMDCQYCVARDFNGLEEPDLVLSPEMVKWINRSPFMVLVLTGGEPLMPPYDAVSVRLIESVKDKGIILDTNGTFMPGARVLSCLRDHGVMVRVSMDSTRPQEETAVRLTARGAGQSAQAAYRAKLENIERFRSAGVYTAVQTVVWRANPRPVEAMVEWLSERGIERWYLQRLIPSYRFREPPVKYALKPQEYYPLVANLAASARSAGIKCIAKMDLRHNSVFLLTADGVLYTQGAKPGQKVPLGTIKEDIKYFDYVSASEHAHRYYLAETLDSGRRVGKRGVTK